MRLKPRWKKVLRDLWGNKLRTTLVVLSIAIGVFAIGMITGTQILLREDLAVAWNGTNPASATCIPIHLMLICCIQSSV